MAKRTKTTPEAGTAAKPVQVNAGPRPRLHVLRICNFRCIGSEPVEVELDDIVVLVGPNNAGKSSILRAYEVVMEHGSNEGKLSIDDFPNGTIDPHHLPTIELETVVYEKTAPGERWVRTDAATNEMFVREKWIWSAPGAPTKVGWDVAANDWHASEGPWGAPNVAQAYRPKPHHVTAFHSPIEQAAQVVGVLKEAIKQRVKDASKKKTGNGEGEERSEYDKLLDSIRGLQKAIATDATTAVEEVRTELVKMISEVFPGYCVTFDARAEDDLEKTLSLFKADPLLKMGPLDGHQATIDRQGSGACRTLLWTALRILAERGDEKTENTKERPHLLLMDEPEICLHPDAIREACRVLYDLPKTKNWQVMITTHSPVFIDLSRDNTSIVRVERTKQGVVNGTTIFRPTRAKLGADDRVRLKMLNLCDPYVAEFFFGGFTIIVEGDTEYTAFKHIIAEQPAQFKSVHVVRARGKASIVSLCKVLNQFGTGYSVLHDSDGPTTTTRKTKKVITNPAWTLNDSIRAAVAIAPDSGKVRLVASIPNFEEAFFGEEAEDEKPYAALERLRTDGEAFKEIAALLTALIDHGRQLPSNATAWTTLEDLKTRVEPVVSTSMATR